MNAPVTNLPTSDVSRKHAGGTPLAIKGVARHVSAEGCQFVVPGARIVAGQRLGFAWYGEAVFGAVRWVLADRIGFAFDRRIDQETCTQMAGQSVVLGALSPEAAITGD